MAESKEEAGAQEQPAKKTGMGVIFLTLFLDLVGFSIIFPLFPSILEHYFALDGPDSFLGRVVAQLEQFAGSEEGVDRSILVQTLFGGLLGSIYSLLQFLFSPFWGKLSDRVGRRPVLILTVAGIALSYLLWAFSGGFMLLIFARILGGIMSGNISTATAAMADVTDRKSRAKGMGMVGMAFGFGFILGPVIGALSMAVDLTETFPSLVPWGLNPFSMPALVALALSLINLVWLSRRFAETLPESSMGQSDGGRTANPLVFFDAKIPKSVHLTNLSYFVFLVAFSGMEFTLTFLVRGRFGWGHMDIALMFVFIGFVLALVQGGVVRRVAPKYGERKVAIAGLALIMPGLVIIAQDSTPAVLYSGLGLMAVGSALTTPSLTALVSLLTEPGRQGFVIGVFRSLGALARAVGPLAACVIYWKWGSGYPYLVGAGILVLPILLLLRVPQPTHEDS